VIVSNVLDSIMFFSSTIQLWERLKSKWNITNWQKEQRASVCLL